MEPKIVTHLEALAPAAHRVASELRSRIHSGAYKPNQWLPTQRELAEEFGVHRRSVNAAIEELSREGLLYCRAGCRPIVAPGKGEVKHVVGGRSPRQATQQQDRSEPSQLVALLMWHGGLDAVVSAQHRIFRGMNDVLAEAGCHGVFLNLGDDLGTELENATREAARLQYALERGFAGVIFYAYAPRNNRQLIREVAAKMPLVLIDRAVPGIHADFVGIDNYQSIRDLTNYLIGLGHRRIAYITRLEPINTVGDRLEGYRHTMIHAGLAETVLTMPPFTDWSVFDAQFRLPADQRPTALMCVHDYDAVKVARRLESLGLDVPRDVSLTGFDDIANVLPNGAGMTTVAQPFEEIGRAAARIVLVRRQNVSHNPEHIELPTELIVRESTGMVRDVSAQPAVAR